MVPSGIVPLPMQVCPGKGANSKMYGTRKAPAECKQCDGSWQQLLARGFPCAVREIVTPLSDPVLVVVELVSPSSLGIHTSVGCSCSSEAETFWSDCLFCVSPWSRQTIEDGLGASLDSCLPSLLKRRRRTPNVDPRGGSLLLSLILYLSVSLTRFFVREQAPTPRLAVELSVCSFIEGRRSPPALSPSSYTPQHMGRIEEFAEWMVRFFSARNMYVGICIEYLNRFVTRGNVSTRIPASVENKTPEVGTQERPPGIFKTQP
jgi:hypothetical protein